MTKQQFIIKNADYWRGANRLYRSCSLLLLSTVFASLLLNLFPTSAALGSFRYANISLGFSAFSLGVVFFILWVANRRAKRYATPCISCGKDLLQRKVAPIAIATGNCSRCGLAAFED
jgi:hypothetical protein